MKKLFKVYLSSILLITTLTPALAASKAATKPVSPWAGSNAALGFVSNTGNTDSESLNGSLALSYADAPWLYTNNLQFQYANSAGKGTTSQSIQNTTQAEYNFSASNFMFGNVDYLNNKFDGYIYVVTSALGYGNVLFKTQAQTLSFQLGPSYTLRRTTPPNAKSENQAGAQFALNYLWQISSNSQLTEGLTSNYTKDNTRTQSTTAISATIVGHLSVQLQYQATYDTQPLPDKKRLNSTTSINLVYNFT